MSWLQNFDPAKASKSFTGILKNIEAQLDAVLDSPPPAHATNATSFQDTSAYTTLEPLSVAPSLTVIPPAVSAPTATAPAPTAAPAVQETAPTVPAVPEEEANAPATAPAPSNEQEKAQLTLPSNEPSNAQVNEPLAHVLVTSPSNEPSNAQVNEPSNVQLSNEAVIRKDKEIQELRLELKNSHNLVKELRKEGEALSKKDGIGRDTIKKLKSKELENARVVSEINRKMQEKEDEIQDLKKTRDKLLLLEQKQTESIKSLNDYNQEISKKLKIAQGEVENVQKELMQLQKEKSLGTTEQIKDYEKLDQDFQDFKNSSGKREDELKQDLLQVRNTLDVKLKEFGRKEDQYQKEIANLNEQLEKSESRMEDLSAIGQEATKPLLRQIESLQAQYNSSLKDWESLEKSMANRVKDATLGKAASVENARILQEENQQLLIQLQNLENLISNLKNDKSRRELELNVSFIEK